MMQTTSSKHQGAASSRGAEDEDQDEGGFVPVRYTLWRPHDNAAVAEAEGGAAAAEAEEEEEEAAGGGWKADGDDCGACRFCLDKVKFGGVHPMFIPRSSWLPAQHIA